MDLHVLSFPWEPDYISKYSAISPTELSLNGSFHHVYGQAQTVEHRAACESTRMQVYTRG